MSHVSERLRRTGFSFLCRIRRKSTKLGQKPYIEAKRIRVLQRFTVAECGFWLLSRYNRRRVQSWLVTRELSEFPRDIDVGTADKEMKQQSFRFFHFSFAVRCYASSFILSLRHTGSSRGCSPLQPSAGSTGPCTRRNAKRSSFACGA